MKPLALLLLAGCASMQPDEYHTFVSYGEGTSTGAITHPALGFSTGESSDFAMLTIGATWYAGTVASHRRVSALDVEDARDEARRARDAASEARVEAAKGSGSGPLTVNVGEKEDPDGVSIGPVDLKRPGGISDETWNQIVMLCVAVGLCLLVGAAYVKLKKDHEKQGPPK